MATAQIIEHYLDDQLTSIVYTAQTDTDLAGHDALGEAVQAVVAMVLAVGKTPDGEADDD